MKENEKKIITNRTNREKKDKDNSNKTISINKQKVSRKWYLIDVKNKILGRVSTKIASILKGKLKTSYTPNIDNGDYVIVINASQIRLTGKKWKQKNYYRHSGYPGGLKTVNALELMNKFPIRILEKSVFGMLPHTKLGNQMRKKLFVYPYESHKQKSQNITVLEV
ncbi:50S ribosomal protein L13 ['Cynodon dactylon' phytoplasma]|uniref:50S ribosomal protein L13 n=1 Tax='Cynodon dactylon' phytoplasma TaxID=295320 RepID=UPI001265C928|nr:50S ribosomal protein L13 ['Cynodon dactylon' phytoplasma]KAB8122009.1 50S ribosomal protein L13 ['Cynodon dactylon' phytoplasma]